MIYTNKFLKSATAKRLPDWIQNHYIFKNTPKIDKIYPKIGLPNCAEPCDEEINDYSTGEPIKKKMHIVFSADGITGLWDIATMSMRGVSSCCHWANGHAKQSSSGYTNGIVGPMTNPNIGIIYLTDGSATEYGLSINKRCLVNYNDYGYDKHISLGASLAKTTNKDPMVYRNHDPDAAQTREIFRKFLRNKVKNIRVC